jgi:hypothetical protein
MNPHNPYDANHLTVDGVDVFSLRDASHGIEGRVAPSIGNMAVTNAFNLAHAGVFPGLQTIPPGGEWRESFGIVPGGF